MNGKVLDSTTTNKELLENIDQKLKLNNELLSLLLVSESIKNSPIKKAHKELLFLLLQHRDRNYIRINHNEEIYERILEYLKLLRPLNIKKSELERVGGSEDGGYVMLKNSTPPPLMQGYFARRF